MDPESSIAEMVNSLGDDPSGLTMVKVQIGKNGRASHRLSGSRFVGPLLLECWEKNVGYGLLGSPKNG